MLARVSPPRRLRGSPRLPGDKSISHRALILNAIAEGRATLSGLSRGADVLSTASCLGALGVVIEEGAITGVGLDGLQPPTQALDCGNSGTTMRLLAGLLAGQRFSSELIGDESLSRRPMDRVLEPLRLMGARLSRDPLRVGGGEGLQGIEFRMPVASAQVKSALLLAGLYARGETAVRGGEGTRNHTELMLQKMGATVTTTPSRVAVLGGQPLRALDVDVPGDLSAAAFWLVAAAIHPDAVIELRAVGTNPTRSGLLPMLSQLGARIQIMPRPAAGVEPVADLVADSGLGDEPLRVGPQQTAGLIDELPALAVLAACLPGVSLVTGASELKVKESDRLAAMARGLAAMGAAVEELPDGWRIQGGRPLHGARVDSLGDHRIAMALAIAALVAEGNTEIEQAECVEISYPGFWSDLEGVCC